MANLPTHTRVDIAFTIPVEQTTTPTGGGQIRLNMRADISKTKRFFRRLQKLCKKYGYTVGEIQTTSEAAQ
ncbi:MAG: hypothetical protein NC548_51750 [Lachnospiraceae bacterium]|nr:hypothetical protein [Lachnospiraceae bacterium]